MKQNKDKKSYILNVLANLISVAYLSLLTIITTPILLKSMGVEAFGLYRLAIVSIVSFSFLLELGLSSSIRKLLGDSINKKEPEIGQHTLYLSIKYYSLISIFILIALSFVSANSNYITLTSGDNKKYFEYLIISAGLYTSSLFIQSIWNAIYIVKGKFWLLQTISMGNKTLHIGITLILINYKIHPLLSATISTTIVSLITPAVSYLAVKRIWPEIKFKQENNINGEKIKKEFINLSKYGFIISSAPVMIYYGQDIFIAKTFSAESLTYYSIAALIATQLRIILNSISSPIFTIASKKSSNIKDLKNVYKNANLLMIFIWALIAAQIFCFSEKIIGLWVGEKYSEHSMLLKIQIIGTLGIGLYLVSYHIMNALGNLKEISSASIAMTVLWFLLALAFAYFTDLKLIGQSYAFSIPLIIRGLYCSYRSHKILNLNLKNLILTILTGIGIFLILQTIFYTIKKATTINSIIDLIIVLGTTNSILFISIYALYTIKKGKLKWK